MRSPTSGPHCPPPEAARPVHPALDSRHLVPNYFARLSIEIQQGYGTSGFDIGLYDQGVWLLSQFKAPFVTIMGRNMLGDHASFILLALVPAVLAPTRRVDIALRAGAGDCARRRCRCTCSLCGSWVGTLVATACAAGFLLAARARCQQPRELPPRLVPRATARLRDYSAIQDRAALVHRVLGVVAAVQGGHRPRRSAARHLVRVAHAIDSIGIFVALGSDRVCVVRHLHLDEEPDRPAHAQHVAYSVRRTTRFIEMTFKSRAMSPSTSSTTTGHGTCGRSSPRLASFG